MARDMTQKQFDAALERYGIRHEGSGPWNTGTYWTGFAGIPVMGFGAPQLDISSRRRLLANLLREQDAGQKRREQRDDMRSLKRGDRVEYVVIGGLNLQGIAVAPADPIKAHVAVICDGHRVTWKLYLCSRPTGRWTGHADLREALLALRDRYAQKIAQIDAELPGATESAPV
jgi:hypothetical protein